MFGLFCIIYNLCNLYALVIKIDNIVYLLLLSLFM